MMSPRITIDPEICGGQPTITGTRVLVEVILDYVAEGYSFQEITESFPPIEVEDVKASIKYANSLIRGTYYDKIQGSSIHS